MRTLMLILALAVLPAGLQAQNFDKYEEMREVNTMVITSNMFKLLAEIDADSQDPEVKRYLKLIESLENIKVISTSDTGIGSQMEADVTSYINGNALEELMRYKGDGKNVKFYSKPGSQPNYVKQLVMLFTGQEEGEPITVALSITGNIDLKEISKLAQDLDVPGASELKKIEEKE